MSNKNRDFKKLLAAICGVASALGGNAASAKGSGVKTVTMGSNDKLAKLAKGSKGKPADLTKNLAVNKESGVLDYVKKNPVKSGVIVGGGVAFTVASILGVRYLLKDKEKPDDDPGGETPPQDKKQPPQEQEQPPQDKKQPPQEQPPQEQKVYSLPFNQVRIKNFSKRVFGQVSKVVANGMVTTTENDFKRDKVFLDALVRAKIPGAFLQKGNFAAFTSQDHRKTIYVVNAAVNSPIRSAFCNCNNRRGVPNMIAKMDVPDLLFFIIEGGKGFFGTGSDWLTARNLKWDTDGQYKDMLKFEVDDRHTELK